MDIGTNGIVINELGQVLLIQRDDTRTFAPPGGALDAHELPTDSVAREVREETGLIVMPVRLVGLYFWPKPPAGMLIFAFRCIQRGGEIQPSPESPVVAFFPAHDLPRPMAGIHRERLKNSFTHVAAGPIWQRQSFGLGGRFLYFLLRHGVYRYKNWQRARRGEPAYLPPPEWVTGAFTTIRNEHGEVLWVKRTDMDMWNLPGGGAEQMEAPWETAVRETQEETGLNVRLTGLASVNVYSDVNHMIFNFTAEIRNGALTTGPEAAAFTYFAPGAEPDNCLPQHIKRVADAASPGGNTIFRRQESRVKTV